MNEPVDLARFFGSATIVELGGGHQSRVFRIDRHGHEPIVAKVLDSGFVDRGELEVRVDVTAALAGIDHRVCRPVPVGGALVTALGAHAYLVCYELAGGSAPDPANALDAALMGRTLAELHQSMRRLPVTDLPVVAALRGMAVTESVQLVHGDFNATNIRYQGHTVRVFDLDDCGYAPPAFDVANALYMVMFDAAVHGVPTTYHAFRAPFVGAYNDTGIRISDGVLDGLIDRRVDALRGWLVDLEHAPIGIRTASPAWLATLQSFVETYQAGGPDTTTT